MMRFTQVLL